jgi:hypothetical protein
VPRRCQSRVTVSLALLCLCACKKPEAQVEARAAVVENRPIAVVEEHRERPLPAVHPVKAGCPSFPGEGVFISATELLTRAQLSCTAEEPFEVRVGKRTLLARIRKEPLAGGFAVADVVGGEGEAIELGNSTALAVSDELSSADSHATIADNDETVLGVPQMIIDFEDQRPPEGTLLFDQNGAAVALMWRSFGPKSAFAAPLAIFTGPQAPRAMLEERTERSARAEVGTMKKALAFPIVSTAVIDARGRLFVQLLRRGAWEKPVHVTVEGPQHCDARRALGGWEPLRTNAAWDLQSQQLFMYLDGHAIAADLDAAELELTAGDCSGVDVKSLAGARVVLEGADPKYGQAIVARTALALEISPDPGPSAPPPEKVARAQPFVPFKPSATHGSEEEWRSRFRNVHQHVAQVEQELQEKQRFVQLMDGKAQRHNPHLPGTWLTGDEMDRYNQYKRDLEHAAEFRAEAQRQLEDLERDAANASVPLEWRR